MLEVCLAMRPGAGDGCAVADAVRSSHPGARVTAVWGGDPHLRPIAPTGCRWSDLDLDEPTGLGWERLLVATSADRVALAKACRVVAGARVGDDGAVVLAVGDAVVCGDVGTVVPDAGMAVVRRRRPPAIADGLAPSAVDFAARGESGSAVLGFGPGGDEWAEALAAGLTSGDLRATVGSILDAVIAERAAVLPTPCRAAPVFAVGFDDIAPETPAVIDVGMIDAAEPWHLDVGGPARVPLSQVPAVAELVDRAARQWHGADRAVRLPGGLEIDVAIRTLVVDAIEQWRGGRGVLPPAPFSEAAAFRQWLATPAAAWGADLGRYWMRWHDLRPDLQAVFPAPEAIDHDAMLHWVDRRWWADRGTVLVRPGAGSMRPPWHDVGREPGINVIGYHGYDKSIGDVARRIDAALAAAEVPFAALDYRRSGSPRTANPPTTVDEVRYDTNLCIINADQIPNLMADYGAVLAGRRTIGYWFWEVEQVPARMLPAIDLVDEIWAGSEFVADAFRAVTAKPVRVVPIPVPEPDTATMARADLGVPDDRFVFLVTFDYLSIAARKNPVGAIEAFRRAFPVPAPGGPVLVVKSLNAHHRPHAHERTLLAAADRPDIIVIDRHATRPEQMALTAAADCLVSLHRSEGLGLHLMEAMWLGTPTIATRYSGNLLFSTDANSALVDVGSVPVVGGEGYLPEGALWADPDLDQAAEFMRRMVADDDWRSQLVAHARATMEAQPSLAETGELIHRAIAGSVDVKGTS